MNSFISNMFSTSLGNLISITVPSLLGFLLFYRDKIQINIKGDEGEKDFLIDEAIIENIGDCPIQIVSYKRESSKNNHIEESVYIPKGSSKSWVIYDNNILKVKRFKRVPMITTKSYITEVDNRNISYKRYRRKIIRKIIKKVFKEKSFSNRKISKRFEYFLGKNSISDFFTIKIRRRNDDKFVISIYSGEELSDYSPRTPEYLIKFDQILLRRMFITYKNLPYNYYYDQRNNPFSVTINQEKLRSAIQDFKNKKVFRELKDPSKIMDLYPIKIQREENNVFIRKITIQDIKKKNNLNKIDVQTSLYFPPGEKSVIFNGNLLNLKLSKIDYVNKDWITFINNYDNKKYFFNKKESFFLLKSDDDLFLLKQYINKENCEKFLKFVEELEL